MNTRLLPILLTITGLLAVSSCDEGDSIPAFIGQWEYDQASPPEEVDSCYVGSWMWIYENREITVYNACEGTYSDGQWKSRAMSFTVWFEDYDFDDFQGKILSLADSVMVVETSMFGTLTRVRFVRPGQTIENTYTPRIDRSGQAKPGDP